VNIQLNIVTCPTYPDKFIRVDVGTLSVLISIVIVTLLVVIGCRGSVVRTSFPGPTPDGARTNLKVGEQLRRRGSVVRASVFGWRTFPDLCLIYG